MVNELRSDKQLLGARCAALDREVTRLREEVERLTVTTPVVQPDVGGIEASESSESSDNESTSDTNETTSHPPSQHSRRYLDPHPPGFRALCTRLEKFSVRTGDNDFEVWVEDFKEATTDCGWNDQLQARWFAWFLAGPAKSTWQRTLTSEDKKSWSRIVEVYCGQYGVHLDPRTAYQRCHELQYSQFGSAQGLLDAMRDYQRMAPTKLTDEVLESILWNKAPLELQKEIKEITVGLV